MYLLFSLSGCAPKQPEPKFSLEDLNGATVVELLNLSKDGQAFISQNPKKILLAKEIVLNDPSLEKQNVSDTKPHGEIVLYDYVPHSHRRRIGARLYFDPSNLAKHDAKLKQLITSLRAEKLGWNVLMMREQGVSEKDIADSLKTHPHE